MTYGPFQQNDAAEFFMLLCDHLETALKGTRHANLLRASFGGKLVQQVIWEGWPAPGGGGGGRQVSEREEDFVTIQLEVKGKGSIAEGLQELIDGEALEGERTSSTAARRSTRRSASASTARDAHHPAQALPPRLRDDDQHQAQLALRLPEQLDLEPYTKRGLDARAAGRPPCAASRTSSAASSSTRAPPTLATTSRTRARARAAPPAVPASGSASTTRSSAP